MKFVALLSGGKDSVFSILECEAAGHECVACANLHPAVLETEEVDSHTFQSIGHATVPGVAECMGLPLFRRALHGGAVRTDLVYAGAAAGDEVEDLYEVLRAVQAAVPGVEAVSSGAIASNYQRTRVEDVCGRLGLRSLAPLWLRPQRGLLHEMRVLDAIVIKTASLGLEPDADLGLALRRRSTRRKFRALHDTFGFHECGEGGEYESLVLDCDRFHKRLVLDDTRKLRRVSLFEEKGMHEADLRMNDLEEDIPRLDDAPRGCGGVGVLCVKKWHCEDKGGAVLFSPSLDEEGASDDATTSSDDDEEDDDAETAEDSAEPPGACALEGDDLPGGVCVEDDDDDDDFVVEEASHVPSSTGSARGGGGANDDDTSADVTMGVGGLWSLGPLTSPGASSLAADQVRSSLEQLRAALEARGSSLRAVCFVHLYIANMGDFAAANAAYVAAFEAGASAADRVRPPSRACVGAALPAGCRAMLDVEVCAQGRDVLYVRSLSKWAPVCIGPYCQANVLHKALVAVSGQIGLDSFKMTLPRGASVHDELATTLRHCDAVLRATPCDSALAHAASAEELRGGPFPSSLEVVYLVDDESPTLLPWRAARRDVERALPPHAPLLLVRLPSLPMAAQAELEVMATTRLVGNVSRRRRRTAQLEDAWTAIPYSLCLGISMIVDQRGAPDLAKLVIDSALAMLRDSALRYEHWKRLRVFAPARRCAALGAPLRALLAALSPHWRPALTLVPVVALEPRVVVAAQVIACDFDRLDADLWLKRP